MYENDAFSTLRLQCRAACRNLSHAEGHDQILVLQLWPMAGIDGYGSDQGNDADDDDDILNAIRAMPLSMPASLRRVLPWHPVGEPQDPCLRHMSVGVASALCQPSSRLALSISIA